ncbi:PaaI family thioesterase [Shewanella litoralis]|uniref:Thioesterase domain-containing protein n=1 Tax=Shewanella litoralis TaxID=2282700 RepID=A0ABQ2RBL4_9GAMM|nr:PaaI family thioesterase [Shewanella litoralis]GGQ23627.1 hypothetical protein GCM10009411_24600 [Shewanella litoralis]
MATQQQIQHFFDTEFTDSNIVIESIGQRQSTIRRIVTERDLRPGGTVSGPFMMALIDASLYATIFSELGLVVSAVTTNLNINFLNKPSSELDVIAVCTLIKLGTKHVVGEVTLYSDGKREPIAHAVGTYSIPKM